MNCHASKIQGWSLAICILLIVGILSTVSANNGYKGTGEEKGDDDVIKIPIELVLLNVAVMDRNHRAVPGLKKDHFQIYEDKTQQQIEYFSRENVPVSVGFVIDTSGSMRRKLPVVIEAAKILVRMARPGDEFFVVQFRDTANLVEEFSCNFKEVEEALDELSANEGTALLDAIYVSANYAQKEARNKRKALVVITDGDERDSNLKSDALMRVIQEIDVQVYLVGFPGDAGDPKGIFNTAVQEKAVKLMNKISEESGGRAFFPSGLFDVRSITEQIGNDIHSQYTIGYFSSNDKRDGAWRRVQVKLQDNKKELKDLAVRTRTGYYAPGQNQRK
jgi:Ca-activated chloride channel homolog